MKKKQKSWSFANSGLLKMIRIMRLTIFIVFFSLSQVLAVSSYSQQTKLTLNMKNAKIEEVIDQIERSTEFVFLYNKGIVDVERRINIDVEEKNVKEILDQIFGNTDVSYTIRGRQILLADRQMQSSYESSQQQKSVSGRVTDASGIAMPGVTVVIKGKTTGTITDAQGNYSIPNVPADATLQFSFVGMKSQEMQVAGKTSINVVLIEETVGIEEVVAIGYGTQKKMNLTGSIVSVNNENIKSTKTASLVDNLAGKLPGLRVMQRTSEPGVYASQYDIRGWGSPLIIVDGIQRDNFTKMDPNEIESVTVLKDASAAIYGVKAANGVILITTKKGEIGKSEITYSNTYGWSQITSFPKPMNAAQYAEAQNWMQQNMGLASIYTQQQIDDYRSGKTPSTSWWDLEIRKGAPQMQHNLTVTGGSEKIKYFGSLGYFNQEGLYKSGDLNYNRYNLRLNITAQVTKNLEAELGVGGISDKKESPNDSAEDIFRTCWTMRPTYPLYANNNPNFLQYVEWNNPHALTHSDIIGYANTSNNTFQGNFALNYKIPFIKGLKARFMYGYDINHSFNKTFSKKYFLYDYVKATDTYTPYTINSPSYMSESYWQNTKSTLQTSLTYEKKVGEHNFSGLLLYENLYITSDNFNGRRYFTVDAVDQLYAGNANMEIGSDAGGIYELDNQGIVGRLTYDYSSKYLTEFRFRYDGSSKFPKGKRWGFFPSVSLGWRLSEESFIKNNFAFVNNLKVRASWGQMGDDAASSFQFISGYTYPATGAVFDGTVVSGLGFVGMTNPNITWYKATTTNIGVDANLWNNKLDMQFEVFRRERTGLLATRILSLPSSVGASLPQENLNSDLSQGLELTLGTVQHIKDLELGVSGNITYTRTKWLYREEAKAGNSYLNWRNSYSNRNKNIIWGYGLDGQFQSQNEINSGAIQDGYGNKYALPGDLHYTDTNEDGVIDNWDIMPIAKGNSDMNSQSMPEINYGLSLTAKWKNIDVSALLQGATNYSVRLIEHVMYAMPWRRNGLDKYYDSWRRADFNDPNSEWIPGTYIPIRDQDNDPVNDIRNKLSSYNIKDATYLRLKNIEIGYTLPDRITKRIGIQNLRVYANGLNLITWSKIPYMDPEHPQANYGYMYPITRNYNIGVNVTF